MITIKLVRLPNLPSQLRVFMIMIMIELVRLPNLPSQLCDHDHDQTGTLT
jgi:hypothetical protein